LPAADHVAATQSSLETLEQDVNDALESVHNGLDAVSDGLDMCSHTSATNERLNDVHRCDPWGTSGGGGGGQPSPALHFCAIAVGR
jgi:hypothetical protein